MLFFINKSHFNMFVTFKGRETSTKQMNILLFSLCNSFFIARMSPLFFNSKSGFQLVGGKSRNRVEELCRCEKLVQCGLSLLAEEGNARESVSLHSLFLGITVRNQIYCLLVSSFHAFDDSQTLSCCNFCWCFWIFNKHLIRIQG